MSVECISMNILVAEDDQFLLKVYKQHLEVAGHNVSICDSGEEALDVAKKDVPDLIILDLILPGKDGFAILEELKSNPETQDVPVIMLTNVNQKVDRDHGLKLGAAEYISKDEVQEGSLVEIIGKYSK